MLGIDIKSPDPKIGYNDNLFIIGSCFTEHMGSRLSQLKFPVMQNPSGILFDPVSICRNLEAYMDDAPFPEEKLVYLNELWQSWEHHSIFSGLDKQQIVHKINDSRNAARTSLQRSKWLIITPGTSFSYQLKETGEGVANCHRAPAQWFNKHLLGIDEIYSLFEKCIDRLFDFNKDLKIIFTVSPVRHIRDGVITNNLSKARLIESVHNLVSRYDRIFYFPAYELVIDVLRDYRFYDSDMVHPNYAATEFVFEKFCANYIEQGSLEMMKEIKNIVTAYHHKPFQAATNAHHQFLKAYRTRIKRFQEKYPHVDFSKEIQYFSQGE